MPSEHRSAQRRKQESYDIVSEFLELPKLKDLCLETDLSRALVVPPDGKEGAKVGRRIAGVIGKGAEVRRGGEVTEKDYRTRTIVAAGGFHTNPVVRHLGMNFYSFTDDYYPGGDGYEVRTIHNPFGHGRNVVLLGGSTAKGVARACEAFAEVVGQQGRRIGRVNLSVSRHNPQTPPDEAEARRIVEEVNTQVALSGSQGPLRRMVDHGMMYHLSGQEVWGRMMREEFLHFIDLAHEVGDWCLSQGTHLYFWGYRMLMAWDLVEEGEVLSDEDRLKMTNALYNIVRWASNLSYYRVKSVDEVAQQQNHQSFAALTVFSGARYFKKYYGLADFDRHVPIADRILKLHARSYKPNDNAGTGYVWLTPGHIIKHGAMTGDLKFLEDGHLKRLVDSTILTTDSLGDDVSYGDVGAYRASRQSRPSGLQALSTAAWFYNDGRYRWAYDWYKKGIEWEDSFRAGTSWGIGGWEVYDGFFFRDIKPVEPKDLLGARAALLDGAAYRLLMGRGEGYRYRIDVGSMLNLPLADADVGEISAPPSEALDKLAFRRAFTEESEYLLIDGPTGFSHSHEDGNGILRLCWNGRIWLADLDYIRRLARYQNSVVIVKDGECHQKPPLIALKALADFEGWGYSLSKSLGDNGTNWGRAILWRKGSYFLVIDSVDALGRGDYVLDCIWRVLGEAEVKDATQRIDNSLLNVAQGGERFHIVNADGSLKRLTDREADFAPDWESNWANYPHADGKVKMWHQTQRTALSAGERTAYINLLYPSNRKQPQSFGVERVGETAVRVVDRRRGRAAGRDQVGATGRGEKQGTVLAGVADPAYRQGDFEVEGRLFRVDADGYAVVEGTSLSYGGTLFRAWSPVSIEMDLAKGRGTILAREETQVGLRAEAVTVDGKRVAGRSEGQVLWFKVAGGRHRITATPKAAGAFAKLVAGREGYTSARSLVPEKERAAREGFETVWSVACGGGVTAVSSGPGGHLVGTASGRVLFFAPDGGTRWSFDAKGAVRAVHLTDIDGCGRAEAMVGTRDCYLHVLDGDGRARWEHLFPPGSGMRAQRLMTISSADLGGDGRTQVLAGAEGWLFHAFEADGTLRWQTETHYHCVTGCLPVDLDGDGKQEVMVGTEYYTMNCLNPDGTGRWRKRSGCVSPTILAEDLDGDGRPEVIYGDWRGIQAVRGGKGETVWTHNLGGELEDIALADVDGDGRAEVIAGSDVGQLACFKADGTPVFRRDLIDKITWLTALDANGDGKAEIAVGFGTGEVRLYDGSGHLLAGQATDGEVTHLRTVQTAEGSRLLCGTAAGTVSLLRPV